MLYRLNLLKEQDVEVSRYLRPGQMVFLKFNPNKENTEVYAVCEPENYIGEIKGRLEKSCAEIKSYEPLKYRYNFEFELFSDFDDIELLMKELAFLQMERDRIINITIPDEKRRREKYEVWINDITKKLLKFEIKRREIEKIYHFTCVDNLTSIIKEGILSLEQLERKNIKYVNNDSNRLDFLRNSTSWCISHPNWFYLKDVKQRFPLRNWCVIEAPAKILWERKCYFSETNAAHSSVRHRTEMERIGVEPFIKMFDEKVEKRLGLQVKEYYRQLHWPNKYTTDVQAEVLIMEDVGVEYISGVYLYSDDHRKSMNLEATKFDFPIKICPELFDYRKE